LPGSPIPGVDVRWSPVAAAAQPPDGGSDRWTLLRADDPTPRHALYRALSSALHPLPTADREQRLAAWRAWADVPSEGRASHRALTVEELRTLAALPGISIGAHTI